MLPYSIVAEWEILSESVVKWPQLKVLELLVDTLASRHKHPALCSPLAQSRGTIEYTTELTSFPHGLLINQNHM